MAIEGPLRELGIHDVFQLLDLSRKTGTLTVTSVLRDNQGIVYFDRGAVIHAAIRSNPHRLGELLLRAGKITEGDITRLREQQRREGDVRRLGDMLVEAGALSRKELERQVRFQVEEVVFEMMSWREGFFSFEEGAVSDAPVEAHIRISTEALLMEGARRIDEWSMIEGKVPHLGVVPVLATVDTAHAGALDLLPKEWEVLAQIDGARDLRAIAEAIALSEFDVARVMYGLVTTGIVELKPGLGAPIPPMRTPGAVPAVAAGAAGAAVPAGPADGERAVELPGALLHVPQLEHTGLHAVVFANALAVAGSPAPALSSPAALPAVPAAPAASAAPAMTETEQGAHEARAEDALAHLERAKIALNAGAAEVAVEAALAAMRVSATSVEVRAVLAAAQLKAGRLDEALETVRDALRLDALNPALHRLHGECAAARGQFAEAIGSWERYLRLSPAGADAPRVRAALESATRLATALRGFDDV